MTGGPMVAAVAVLGLLLGILLMLAGRGMRQRRGLGGGKTVSLDRITLTSRRYGLIGRPDRLVKTGGQVVPEEWKSSRMPRPWHQAQLGVYFLLIEDQLRVKPPHGFIVCGDGTRHRVENTADLRAWVLELAEQIRNARKTLGKPIAVNPNPGQCRPCGQLANCGQGRAQ